MPAKLLFGVFVIACAFALASCGGGHVKAVRSDVIAQIPAQNDSGDTTTPANGGGDAESSGPIPDISQLDRLITNPRQISEALRVVSYGTNAYYNGLTGTTGTSFFNVQPFGTDLTLRAFAKGEYSYAVYGQDIDPTVKPLRTRITSSQAKYGITGPKSEDPIPFSYYVGFADYTVGSWRWFGPFSAANGEVMVNSETLKSRFVSPSNRFYTCILASNGSKATSALPNDGMVAQFPFEPLERAMSDAAEDPGGLIINDVTTWTDEGLLTAPAMITGLEGNGSGGSVHLSWDESSDSTIDFYEIHRDDLDDDTPREMIGQKDGPTYFYNDSSNIPAKYYRYWVRAHNEVGYGGEARVDAAGYLIAPGVGATDNVGDRISLNWPSTSGALIYHLYRSDSANGIFELLGDFNPGENVYDDLDVPFHEWRYYRMSVDGEDFNSEMGAMSAGIRAFDPLEWYHTWDLGYYGTATGTGVDSSGNVYVAGYTLVQTTNPHYDSILLKYSSEGLLLWERSWGGASNEFAQSLAVDADGNSYIVGRTGSYGAGQFDIFVLRYDADGNLVWQKTWGGARNDLGYGVALDGEGFVYAVGDSRDYSVGEFDAVILKYDINGNLIWQRTWGSDKIETAYSVAASQGLVWVTGKTRSFGDGGEDVFVLQLNSDGLFNWEKVWQSGIGRSIAVDSAGNAYVAADRNLHLKYNISGYVLYSLDWGSGWEGNGIAIDESGPDTFVYLTGTEDMYNIRLVQLTDTGALVSARRWTSYSMLYYGTGKALVTVSGEQVYLCGVGSPTLSQTQIVDDQLRNATGFDLSVNGSVTEPAGIEGAPSGTENTVTGTQDNGGMLIMSLDASKM